MAKKIIKTDKAPAAIGPYSQAVMYGDMLFCSGQLGLDPETGDFVKGGVESQARQMLENAKEILEEAGMSFSNVVKTNLFLNSMEDFVAVNKIYGEYFEEPYPARAAVEVSALPKGGLIEMELVAGK